MTVLNDTHAEGEEVMLLLIKSATGAQMGDRVATGTIKDDDASGGQAQGVGPRQAGPEGALALVAGLSPREAAAALFGEVEFGLGAGLRALNHLGNRNGRYDHGDLISWVERCQRGQAKCIPNEDRGAVSAYTTIL